MDFGQFPQLREWIGPRHIHGLKAHRFTIKNLGFESTIPVDRHDLQDPAGDIKARDARRNMGKNAQHGPGTLAAQSIDHQHQSERRREARSQGVSSHQSGAGLDEIAWRGPHRNAVATC